MAKALTVQSVERFKPDPGKRLEVADGLLPGLYFVLQPSGVRSWAVRYRHAGKPRKLTLGPYPVLDLGAARTRAREALQVVALGRDPASEKQHALKATRLAEPGVDTVAAIVATFLERHARAKTKANTADDTERHFRLRVLPKWGERRIQDITRRDVIALLDGIVDKGTPIAANRALAAVTKFFNWSLDRSIIETSPCIRVARPSVEKSRDRVLTDDELRLIWKAAARKGWPFGPLVQTLMLTAQRRTEVGDMGWGELKDRSLWTIPGSRTKNGAEHDVALSPAAQDILSGAPRITGSQFVFTTSGVRPISGYSQAKERLDALMLQIARQEATEVGQDAAAVMVTPWRLHDLRRTAASGTARMGIPVHIIEAVLNHRSGAISGAVYNRFNYMPEKRGYFLTGSTREHALFFGFGTGANGKTVTVGSIAGVLADYHRTASVETFTASASDRHPTELAGLRGARLVTASETEQGRKWAESRIKMLTGGEKVEARFMRQDFFEFQPQLKLLICGNHKPGLNAVDEAIRRRFHLIPFTVTIPTDERDETLPERLKTEWPGILAWMVEGCLAWQRGGLKPPAAVLSAAAAYLEGEDLFGQWLADDYDVDHGNSWKWEAVGQLFDSWTTYATRAGEKPGSKKAFSQAMQNRGFASEQGHAKVRAFTGLRLKPRADHRFNDQY